MEYNVCKVIRYILYIYIYYKIILTVKSNGYLSYWTTCIPYHEKNYTSFIHVVLRNYIAQSSP